MRIIDMLYTAISEIAYYRCSLPETYFEQNWVEASPELFQDLYILYILPASFLEGLGLNTHRLLANKSVESDMLLNVLGDACNALSKGCVKSLAFGISVNPDDAMYIREMYAFQFKENVLENDQNQTQSSQSYESINMCALRRLILLLQEMESLSVLTFVTSQLTLFSTASKDYKPSLFQPAIPNGGGYYTIMPQFGSAQVGTAVTESGIQVRLCVLSVEGSVCEPPLGFSKCGTPVRMDIDNDPHVQVFTAIPSLNTQQGQVKYVEANIRNQLTDSTNNQNACGVVTRSSAAGTKTKAKRFNLRPARALQNTSNQQCECRIENNDEELRTCHRCKRKHHAICYNLEGGLTQLLAVCITCQTNSASILPTQYLISRLALARRAAFIAYRNKEGHVMSLIREIGCKPGRGKCIVDLLHTLGFIQLDKNKHSHEYKIDSSTWPTIHNSLFSSSIETALKAVGYK
ncbi:hypothetical protein COEREDRAFT_87762 [Coemansia reversa NRRL 1564]|uniref:HORMA domain-containing protein n=1 Tax=Coemansia reversa (strain ATCC 12441 / NRRL 1564) TaxID=763665 RepID=A0A2G5BA19_COERN|nr:hypothetical protein COEREDRAFT_87762 [Coemansia reversa NRRL 1564]|eukprot:PIA15577.1 hypothetical protein COEREDRAFT_87762 [Coemansia reversa NRRL 1564]